MQRFTRDSENLKPWPKLFNVFDARLDKIADRFNAQGIGVDYCSCSPYREILMKKLIPEMSYDQTCKSDAHNPRPITTTKPEGSHDDLMCKLFGEDWESMPEQENVATEARDLKPLP